MMYEPRAVYADGHRDSGLMPDDLMMLELLSREGQL
jgi:hypothetical protein